MSALFSRRLRLYLAILVTLSVSWVITPAFGQGITTGTILGTVTDPSGAVIPNAAVTAIDIARGANLTTQTGSEGGFSFRAVPIGTYRVEINASGFSKGVVENVAVQSGVTTNLGSVEVKLGATEQVVVSGATTPLLNTTDSQVSTTFDSQSVQSLPLNNGFDTITELVPGVVSTHGDNFSNTNGDNFSVNGQSGRANNFEFDGQANNDNSIAGPQIFFGSQDAIQEIQVITNNYSAQYGRNAGAVVNYITKSGSNSFHGSGFEFYQGNFMSSLTNAEKNPLFGFCGPGQSPAATGCTPTVVPRYVENRYGGTLGGPIWKDKIFFFGSTFWEHVRTGASPSQSLPFITPTSTGIQQLQAAFPGNPAVGMLAGTGPYGVSNGAPAVIPGTTVNQSVTGPGGVSTVVQFGGVQRLITTPFNDEEDLGRIDWQPTSKDHLFGRYFYQNDLTTGDTTSAAATAAGSYFNVPGITHSIGADWTHTFNDRWVDQLRYSFQQSKVAFEGGGADPNCLITSIASCPTSVAFIGGTSDLSFGLNSGFPQGRVVKVTQIQDNATWSHGRHTILFGGEFDYQNSPDVFLPFYNGEYQYSNFSSFLQDSGAILLANGNPVIPFTEPDAAGYIQDDWKVTPTFTAHLGMRWEYFGQAVNKLHDETVARESNPATAFWNTSLPLADRTVPAVNEYYKGFEPRIGFAWNPQFDRNLVVNAGYAINANPAFYNIFLLDAIASPVANTNSIGCPPCQPASGSGIGAAVRTQNLPALPTGGNPQFSDQTYVPTNFRTPYVQTWTLALQHQLGKAAVGEIRYVGSKTTKNFQSVNQNPYLLPVATAFPNLISPASLCQGDPTLVPGVGRPSCNNANLAFVTNGGWADYSGLLLNLTTQNYHGLSGTVSYTWSRSVSNVTDVFASSSGAGSTVAFSQNPLNPDSGEIGVDGNSFPNVLAIGLNYQVPNYAKSNGLLSRVVNGFTITPFYRFNSGQPYNAFQPLTLDSFTGDTSFCDFVFNSSSVGPGTDTCRLVVSNPKAPLNTVAYYNPYTGPFNTATGTATLGTPEYVVYNSNSPITDANGNVIGYNPGTPVSPSASHWIINNQAYAQLVGNPYPGSSRNNLRGQSFSDLDITIIKNTKLTERVNLQLSLAAYNLTNTMFRGNGQPNVAVNSPTGFNSFLSNAEQSSGSISGNTSGNRFFLLGGKIVF